MDLYEAIENRRSWRKYDDRPVTPEQIEKCLDAARWAPSWVNFQVTKYVVVTDSGMREKLADTLSEKNPARKAVATAPVVVVFVGELGLSGFKKDERCDDKEWYMFDVACAMQNFCLAAHAEGLGTVMVGLFDYRKAAEVLGVPETHQVVALTPLGHATGGDRPAKRKDMSELRHDGKW